MKQIVSVVAGLFLGIVSNYIYEQIRQRGWLPNKPTVRFLSALTAVVVTLIFFVAWADLTASDEVADRPVPTSSVTPRPSTATQTSVPPSATRTPAPTLTSEPPARTPRPTWTPRPTRTPRPTPTITPKPTAIPMSVYTFENGIGKDWEVVESFGFANGALEGPGFMLYNKNIKNYQVKIVLRGIDFTIYTNAESRKRGYFFTYWGDNDNKCGWYQAYVDLFSGLKEPGWTSKPMSILSDQCNMILSDNGFHDLIIRVQDNNFFASIDGQDVAGFADRTYTDGKLGIAGGNTTIKTIEITPLP